MKLNELTIVEAHQGMLEKKFSSQELTQVCLERIKKLDPEIKAFLTVTPELALKQAQAADKKIKEREGGVLTGIPLAIKDNILIDGVKATGGSKILENYTAAYDATVISRLKQADAVLLGKTNLDEFAMGSSTENSALAKTCNPWDTTRVPGGSSGGSAAAVAASMCLGALGSDTGGSIRQPAAFCGVVGLKPTYGAVSRYGLMAMTSSLDQIGPLSRTVKDAAYLHQAIAGLDKNDSTSQAVKSFNMKEIEKPIKGMKIGVPKEYFIEGMDVEVEKSVKTAINELKKMGAKIVDVSLPLTKYALAVYQLTVTSEVSTNLARYDGIRYGYSVARDKGSINYKLKEVYNKTRAQGLGDEAKRRIILGTYALSAGYYDQYYVQAQKVRQLIRKEFEAVFKKVDCLVTPTAPSVAFKLGEKFADPLMMYLSDIYTVPANIGGICAISVPCGFAQGLPIGLQVMAKAFDETTMFRLAYHYEQSSQWHIRQPSIDS